MEDPKESNGGGGSWMSVPTFGDWDMKHGVPDYSMDFSKIREMRKQNKKDFSRISVGNEEELAGKKNGDAPRDEAEGGHSHRVAHHDEDERQEQHGNHSQTGRKKFRSYFSCCVGA